MARKFYSTPPPRILGHRGAAGQAPENTLPSFALALALGADVLEFDVHPTRDGFVVVIHDDTVDRTTDGSGLVRELTLRQIEQLDAGYHFSRDGRDFPFRGHGVRIPTFPAVLQHFPLATCNVEIKENDGAFIDEVIATIRRLDATHRVLVAAENGDIMDHVRRHAPDLVTSFSAKDVLHFMDCLQHSQWSHYEAPGIALQIPPRVGDIELVRPELVAAAHRLGIEVHVWTINDPEQMRSFLDMGVDGIVSDLPGLAHVVARQFHGGRI
ncbi:MAG: glycerophosphoryl diester phosphodiesterase [Candidatus Binatia bacterium]|nr:MAG: glycerophosphoryl diester phosphodiesterase [Candidatus Binatia bacterium]